MSDIVGRNRKIEQAADHGQAAAEHASPSAVGQAVSTAGTAMEIYGKVMGATGNLSEAALMPAFQALSFMQGIACLPASSHLDPVIGIDVHFVMIPPSPSPIPMPHPYIAMIMDPKDWVSCAVMSVAAMAAPVPTGNADADAAASLAFSIGMMALSMAGLGATVKLGGFTPRTTSGTKNKTIPHFPMGASFAPVPVLKNSGHAQFGSLFLNADGNPFTGLLHLNNDCWDIGIMQLLRKKAPPEAMHLFMPTGFIMAIPSHNVLVNPIPTPINPVAALTKLLNAGFAKLLHGILDKLPFLGRLGDMLSKVVCHVTGHPVDVVSGTLFTDEEDFALPGVLPFSFERTWYSDSIYKGPLGYGWYHKYDMGFHIDARGKGIYRMNDGRPVVFELPAPGQSTFNRTEKLFLHCHTEDKYYYVSDTKGLVYRFTARKWNNRYNKEEEHLLQSISNTNGYAIRFEYSRKGVLARITDSAGRVLQLEHDLSDHITRIVAPHPTEAGKTFVIAQYAYDDDDNLVCQTDALGQKMQYEYENHLLVKETWRNGMQWYFVFDGKASGAKCIHTWGDGGIHNHKLTYYEGSTVVENSLGHQTVYNHKNGLLHTKVDAAGAAWKYRYNRFNDLEWETDPLGNQQSYTHDEWGNLATSTDAAGGFTCTEFYNPQFPGLPTESMDAGGGKWYWQYDAQGNVVESTTPLGAVTSYVYNDGILAEIITATGAVTSIQYDKHQNITVVQTDDGARTSYTYDELGNCLSVTNPNNREEKRWYDPNGRLQRIHAFDGNQIELTYDGIDNVVCYRDLQKEILYTYYGLWKMTSRTEGGATVYFNYDTEEQLRKVINQHGQPYQLELDPLGNIMAETGFDNTTRHYQRNEAGWVTKISRPAGKFTQYKHDPCGRITTVQYSDAKTETYSYRPDGALMKVINESATVEFVRDVRGNILKETVNGQWVASAYNTVNKRISTTSSLGAHITHGYNKMGDVEQTTANGWLARFEHDHLGLEIQRLLPGNISSRWQRDGIGRPLVHNVQHTTNQTAHQNKKYVWDVNERLKQMKDGKGITTFEHDRWSNLCKTVFPDGETQWRNPDAVGNLFKTEDRKDRHYTKGGKLNTANGWNYSYDAEGNLIEKSRHHTETWRYEWNDAGMLVKVIKPDAGEVTFTYDAMGRRLSKQYKNTITRFAWDGNTPLHEWKEHAVTGQQLSEITIGNNELTTWIFNTDAYSPAAKIKGDKQYSIITDHLGTPCQMFKEDGQLLWDAELDSYGKVRMEKGDQSSCPFRYQGQYEDAETGLYYNRFRYYAPEEGMYISADPIGLKGGIKLFSYVHDINSWIDPFGLATTYRRKNGQFGKKPGPKTKRKDRKSEYPSGYRAGVVEAVIQAHTVNGVIIDRDGNPISRSNVTIEHSPSIVDHWNNGGNNMSRPERNDAYNDTANLTILPAGQNSSEGAQKGQTTNYTQQTGPNYSS